MLELPSLDSVRDWEIIPQVAMWWWVLFPSNNSSNTITVGQKYSFQTRASSIFHEVLQKLGSRFALAHSWLKVATKFALRCLTRHTFRHEHAKPFPSCA